MSTPGRITTRAPLSISAWLRYDAVARLFPADVHRVVEVGAGLGSFGVLLSKDYAYVGLEPDMESYDVARRRVGESGVVLNTTAEEFRSSEPFDVVCAFEVLEHTRDDRSVLTGWLRHVRPGGFALLSVPFARDRYGPWDRKAGHYRRYDRADIVTVMESVGLQSVQTIVYGFPLGLLLESGRHVVARIERRDISMEVRTAESGRQLQPPPWTSRATWVVAAPFRLVQRPFSAGTLGTGIVALGRKPDE